MPMNSPRDNRPRSLGLRAVAVAAVAVCSLVAVATHAQPSFVGVDTNNTGEAKTTLTVNVPAGAAGDLLVAVLGVKVNPSTVTPSGYTPVTGFGGFNQATCGADQEGIACQLAVFWRIADNSETSVTFTWGGTLRQAAGAVLRYSGTDQTSPIGAAAKQSGASANTVTAPSVNTTQANSRVLRVAVAEGQDAESLLLTPPSTERYNLGSFTPFVSGNSLIEDSLVIAGSDAVQAAAGPTGTASWTLPGNGDEYVAGTIEIIGPLAIVDTDIAIDKQDDPNKVNPEGSLTYTLTVSNNGPNDAADVSVEDDLDDLLLENCTWTCSAAGASSCGNPNGSGDLSETVDVAVGDDVTFTITCDVAAGASGSIGNTATVAVGDGFNDTEPSNDSDSTSTPVNQPPIAVCQDVELEADQITCTADVASSEAFDGGSSDPDGDLPLAFSHAPLGPYGLGDTAVALTVEDALGLSDTCDATATVVDVSAPVVSCNDQSTIVPPDAPISFTATATDACGDATVEILEYDCFKFTKKGKRIDKTGSCVVSIDGDSVTIEDSGGVGTTITWIAKGTDEAGNMIEINCGTEVVNPGKGKALGNGLSKEERRARRAERRRLRRLRN